MSKQFYADANKKGITVSVHYLIVVEVYYIICILILWSALAIYYYKQDGYIDQSKWLQIYKLSTPFDQTTVMGYFGYSGICTGAGIIFFFLQITILSFFISACLFLRACCFDHKTFFDEMDQLTKSKMHKFDRNHFKQHFVELVQFNIKIKSYVCII